MRKFLQKLKNNDLLLDSLNVGIGFVLIVTLAVFMITGAYLVLLLAVWAAGMINMVNGFKTMKKKAHATLGQSMVFLGMIILVGGSVLVISMMQAGV